MNSTDYSYMALAIQIARKGLQSTSPNPRVGCVIVKDERIIGQGFHVQAGKGHAEVNALADCAANNFSPVGATAYVTLEPCSHFGRTPPCAKGLVEAGIERVVIGQRDPNPKVAGNGIKILEDAGISVEYPCLEAEATALNIGFNKRMLEGMPHVIAKVASSLDGRTAMASGESKWITADAARADVQRLRAQSCAIITGIGTVLDDDPSLLVRDKRFCIAGSEEYRQPLHVIVDSKLRIDPECQLLNQGSKTLVVFAEGPSAEDPSKHQEKCRQLEQKGAELLHLPNAQGDKPKVDLLALLKALAARECNEVMIEAGARLSGVFLQNQLIDTLIYYIAPTLLGSEGRPQVELPLEKMAEQVRLDIQSLRQVGDDIRIEAKPVYLKP